MVGVGVWVDGVDLYPCMVIRGGDTSHLRYSRTPLEAHQNMSANV